VEIPEGYAQVNLIWTGTSVPLGAQCAFGIEVGSPLLTPAGVGDAVRIAFEGSDLDAVIATGCNLTTVLVKFGPTATGPSAEVPAVVNGTGGNAMDSPGVATLLRKLTAFGGRSGRGRMYLPCTPEAGANPGGRLTPTFQAQVDARAESFLDKLEVAEIPMVLLHRAGAPLTVPDRKSTRLNSSHIL